MPENTENISELALKKGLRRMPGDPPREEMLARMVRVDHAGEFALMSIHNGQLAVLKQSASAPTIKKMVDKELQHLRTFDRLLLERRVRPTLLQPLWQVVGFALGAGSALLGEKAAMACTVAFEEAIEEHHAEQVNALGDEETELRQVIEDQQVDEIAHRDIGIANGASEHPLYPVLTTSIKTGTKLAIWLSTRL